MTELGANKDPQGPNKDLTYSGVPQRAIDSLVYIIKVRGQQLIQLQQI